MSDDGGRGDTGAHRFGRRGLLRAVGTGTALSAAGVVGAQTTGTPSGESEAGGDETATPGADSAETGEGDGPSSAFGFPALSADVDPPVEPDHTVEVHIRPREGSEIPEFFFEPTGLAVEPGDTVKFDYASPHHTVTAYHPAFGFRRRVPEGVPPFSAPVLPEGGYWLYTFEAEGVYDYHCGPHEAFGHVGRVVSGSAEGFEPLPDLCAERGGGETRSEGGAETGDDDREAGTDGGTETETPAEGGGEDEGEGGEEARFPFLTAHTVLSDPALDPENVLERGSVSWDDLDPESKRVFVEIRGFPPCSDGC